MTRSTFQRIQAQQTAHAQNQAVPDNQSHPGINQVYPPVNNAYPPPQNTTYLSNKGYEH